MRMDRQRSRFLFGVLDGLTTAVPRKRSIGSK